MFVRERSRWIVLYLGLFVGLVASERAALAQDPLGPDAANGATATLDDGSLERVRAALATSPVLDVRSARRFYALTLVKSETLADEMKRWDLKVVPTTAPGQSQAAGGGIDLLQLLSRAAQAHRDHEVSQIRAEIERELRALSGVR
jgi:hypothetical protein